MTEEPTARVTLLIRKQVNTIHSHQEKNFTKEQEFCKQESFDSMDCGQCLDSQPERETVRKSGYLYKQSGTRSSKWAQRLFLLEDTSLTWVKQRGDATPRGEFLITADTIIRRCDIVPFAIELCKQTEGHSIPESLSSVLTPSEPSPQEEQSKSCRRILRFSAANRQIQTEWLSSLSHALWLVRSNLGINDVIGFEAVLMVAATPRTYSFKLETENECRQWLDALLEENTSKRSRRQQMDQITLGVSTAGPSASESRVSTPVTTNSMGFTNQKPSHRRARTDMPINGLGGIHRSDSASRLGQSHARQASSNAVLQGKSRLQGQSASNRRASLLWQRVGKKVITQNRIINALAGNKSPSLNKHTTNFLFLFPFFFFFSFCTVY